MERGRVWSRVKDLLTDVCGAKSLLSSQVVSPRKGNLAVPGGRPRSPEHALPRAPTAGIAR